MTRRPDPTRIEAARRAAAIARLTGAGELPDRAEAWVRRFESATPGARDRSAWEAFDAWLASARAGRDSSRAGRPPESRGRRTR